MQQNQNQIKNPQTEVPKTAQMNDRDMLNDMLSTEKYMTASYSVALNEASHAAFFQDLSMIFNETQQCQRDLFNLMFKKGWYKMDAEQSPQLQQSHQQFSNYKTTQFPYQNPMQ